MKGLRIITHSIVIWISVLLCLLLPETAYAGNFTMTAPAGSSTGSQSIQNMSKLMSMSLGTLTVDNSALQTSGWNVTVQTTDVVETTPAGGYANGTNPITLNHSQLQIGSGWSSTKVFPGTPNILSNPSFDTYTGANGLADGWTTTNNGSITPTYAVVTTPLYSDPYVSNTKAQQITATNINNTVGSDKVNSPAFSVSPSSPYVVTYRVNITALSNLGMSLYLVQYDSSNTVLSNTQIASWSAVTSGYTSTTYNFTSASTAATARLVWQLDYKSYSTNSGTVYLDDFYVGTQDNTANPTITAAPNPMPINTAVKVISAPVNGGMGVFNFTLGSLQFYLRPYQNLDYVNYAGGNTPFQVTITWTFASGP